MNSFRVTLSGQARHGILWQLLQKYKSQKEFAEFLGISQETLGKVLNLKMIPDITSPRFLENKRWANASKKLMNLTGRPLEEIFPPEMANQRLKTRFEETRDIPVQQLLAGERLSFLLPERDEDELAEVSQAHAV